MDTISSNNEMEHPANSEYTGFGETQSCPSDPPKSELKDGLIYGSQSSCCNNGESDAKMKYLSSEETGFSNNQYSQGESLNARTRMECEQWKERGRQSQIFGGPTGDEIRGKNNTKNWPWQEQSINSSIFENGTGNPAGANGISDTTGPADAKKWPWQQKAQTSNIFNPSPEGKATPQAPPQKYNVGKKHYDWNQTKCTHDFGGDYSADDRFQRGPNLGVSNSKAKILKRANLSGRTNN